MNRAQLLTALAAMVEDGELTEEEAALIIALYDRGEIPEESLPLPPGRPPVPTADQGEMSRDRAQLLSDNFRRQAEIFAESPLQIWHSRMRGLIASDLAIRTAGGYGSSDVPATLQERLDVEVSRQTAYLQRFAEQRFVRKTLPERTTMSEAKTKDRSGLYGGAGYARYWYGRTAREDRSGMIVRYYSMDDDFVCAPCIVNEEESPYLTGQPFPKPAEDCLGRDRCRCWLEYEYAPEVAASLA